jgi:hypothetical protein
MVTDHYHIVVLLIYLDSCVFVAATYILSQGFGLNSSIEVCHAANLLCLICYMSTKVGFLGNNRSCLNKLTVVVRWYGFLDIRK